MVLFVVCCYIDCERTDNNKINKAVLAHWSDWQQTNQLVLNHTSVRKYQRDLPTSPPVIFLTKGEGSLIYILSLPYGPLSWYQLLYFKCLVLQKSEVEEKEKKKEIVVLDMKRSQAINIALTKLPPVRTVKQAIVNMDSSVIDREGIDVSLKSHHHPVLINSHLIHRLICLA